MPTARVGDIELYYEEHGQGAPLVLIMGLAADSQAWMFQVPALSRSYRTLVFDNRGVGRSSKPPGPYTTAQMADDTAGLMAACGIDSAHVAGVSLGGMIAQELALRHPERVQNLVLACTYARPDDEIKTSLREMVAALGGMVTEDGRIELDLSSVDPMTFFQLLMPRTFSADFLERELPTLMQLFSGALQWGFSMEAILAQVHAAMNHDTVDRLPTLRARTLVITGDADELIPPRCSKELAGLIPNATLALVEGGSHGFNFEMPDRFNEAVLGFLRER